MYALVLITLFGQTVVPDHQVMIEEMLAHIYVAAGPEAMQKAQEHFKSQSPSQVRIIYRVFLDAKEAMVQAQQQAVLNQAKLNLAKAEAYRDHLKREFQMTMHVKQQELEVLKSANAWMRNWAWRSWPHTYPYYPNRHYRYR